mmetsp:Transcript_103455/g.267572  ORF Transcript_103455/g.267572 Transcript_103455/m.267572 type:complete len:426 (-) Transcript_103455:423-1700(-)
MPRWQCLALANLVADLGRLAVCALEVDVHMPDIDGSPSAVVVVIPGNHIVRLPGVQPCLYVLAQLPVLELLPAPDGPVLDVLRQVVGVLVRLDMHVSSVQHLLINEARPVAAVGAVHPREPRVLRLGHLVVALPRPDANLPARAPRGRRRARARRRLAVALLAGPQRHGSRARRRVEVEVLLRPLPLAGPLAPVLQPLGRVRLARERLEARLHDARLVPDDLLGAPLSTVMGSPIAISQHGYLHGHVHPEQLGLVACIAGGCDAAPKPTCVRATGVEDKVRLPGVCDGLVERVRSSPDAPPVDLLIGCLVHVPRVARVPALEPVRLDVHIAAVHAATLHGRLAGTGQAHEEQGVGHARASRASRSVAARRRLLTHRRARSLARRERDLPAPRACAARALAPRRRAPGPALPLGISPVAAAHSPGR